jgi:hypothetical protein
MTDTGDTLQLMAEQRARVLIDRQLAAAAGRCRTRPTCAGHEGEALAARSGELRKALLEAASWRQTNRSVDTELIEMLAEYQGAPTAMLTWA